MSPVCINILYRGGREFPRDIKSSEVPHPYTRELVYIRTSDPGKVLMFQLWTTPSTQGLTQCSFVGGIRGNGVPPINIDEGFLLEPPAKVDTKTLVRFPINIFL